MNIFDEKRAELEKHEFMMVGQHGVYCPSSRNPAKPALDLQAVLAGMEGAKALIQSVMEELRVQRDAERS